ncbi:hypothetical protein Pla110_44990 [Polystyrenella longa]|uniref:DUF4412 domain-containing protein n=1 Tax=Polystyrenella longa TaxID=2528007 RepID=A0A518CU34_9PLAN|nr:hypothetical protein [Polystyrenella longa]QDU82737.1 hypothetical protein Pla110_44990 [Polystyrenella longa]
MTALSTLKYSVRTTCPRNMISWGTGLLWMLPVCWLLCAFGGASSAEAQEFSMYTKVYDDSLLDRPVVSRSLTMFHAGEVYDYLDGVGEVIIMQPIRKKFVILNLRSEIQTEISFAEIENMLQMADDETTNFLKKLANEPHDEQLYRRIRFYQEPHFSRSVDVQEKQLKLTSPYLTYSVNFHNDRPEEYVRKYLDFADWVKKLNYVRHPIDTSYRARVELNNRMRSIQALPLTIQLTANTGAGEVKLRSEHHIDWKLNQMHKEKINLWNQKIKSNETRSISIAQYQQNLHAQR